MTVNGTLINSNDSDQTVHQRRPFIHISFLGSLVINGSICVCCQNCSISYGKKLS